MLEYVYFDFKFFGLEVRVSVFFDFFLKINEYNCVGFYEVVNYVVTEIIDGLVYFYGKGIVYRDLKTANILVSN